MSCRDRSRRTPGGLEIEAEVDGGWTCAVDRSGNDRHRVTATNRSLITWQLTVTGTCVSSEVTYPNLGGPWQAGPVTIPPRPGKGGKFVVSEEEPVASVRPAPHQRVSTEVEFCEVGQTTARDTIWLQVKAR